jgi:hypothetical protein
MLSRPSLIDHVFSGIRTALLRPTLVSKVSRQAGSIVRGFSKPRRRSENGPAAGGRYVLRARDKVKARRLRQNRDDRIGSRSKSAPVEGLKVHGRPAAAPCGVLRQTSGALRRTEGATRPFAASRHLVRCRKARRCKRLSRMTRPTAYVTVKFGRLLNRLRRIRARCTGRPRVVRHENPTPDETLTPGLRFTQNSNINCTDESCGKLKATRSDDSSCGKTRFFRGADVAADGGAPSWTKFLDRPQAGRTDLTFNR